MTAAALCVVTCQRPVGLARLLESVAGLDVPDALSLRLVVVDNDTEGSAREVVETARTGLRWPLTYRVEPERGIPFARNRAVALARESGADFVVFVDDDQEVPAGWLSELLKVQAATRADVVSCPCIARFESPVPDWIRAGRFFDHAPPFATGEDVPYNYARTSGVLVAAELFAGDAPFDAAYAFSGGSDRHFFHRASLDGRRIVWAAEAVIYEYVPPTRATAGWLIRRAHRTGNSRSLTMVDLEGTPLRRLKRFGGGLRAVLSGVWRTVAAIPRGRAAVLRGVQRLAYGIGLITGVLGIRAREYRVIHGS